MPQNGAAIDAVVFDVGETILDETWEYGAWADWLDVPRHTFSSVFGAVIATGGDYRDAFQRFRPGFDLHAEREKRADAGVAEVFTADDLYQDAVGCLSELCALGIRVGLAGNQTARNERTLRGLDLPVDFIGTSENWGWRSRTTRSSRKSSKSPAYPASESSTSATGWTTMSGRRSDVVSPRRGSAAARGGTSCATRRSPGTAGSCWTRSPACLP